MPAEIAQALIGDSPEAADLDYGCSVRASVVYMLLCAVFVNMSQSWWSAPILPFFAEQYGVDAAWYGYLVAVKAVSASFIGPMLVSLCDRFGRKKILVVCLAGSGTVAMGQGLAWTYWALFGCRFLQGVFDAANAVVSVYLADVCTTDALPKRMAQMSTAAGLSQAIAPGMSGMLVWLMGLRIAVVGEGFVTIVSAAIIVAFLPESPNWEARARNKAVQEQGTSAAHARLPAPVFILMVTALLRGANYSVGNSMLPILLKDKFGFDAQDVANTFVLSGTFTIIGTLVAPPVMNRAGLLPTAVLGSLLDGVFSCLVPYARSPFWVIIVRCFAACCTGLFVPANMAMLKNFTNESNRGLAQSRIQIGSKLGQIFGPAVGGWLALQDSAHTFIFKGFVCFTFCGVCSVLLVIERSR